MTAGADEEFVAALHRQHRSCLLRFVRRLLPQDPHRAEDVVQETLLRAWRRAPTLRTQTGPVRPWLFTVARNLVIDGRRRDQARPRETDDAPLERLARSEGFAEAALDRRIVLAALSDLSPPHREVLLRAHYLDQTGPEVAATLGIPPGTVKSRSHHAVRALRQILATQGVTGC